MYERSKITLVVGVGGFLGLGEKQVAVEFAQAEWVERDGDRWLVVPTTKEQLEAQAEFDPAPYEPEPAAVAVDTTAPAGTTAPSGTMAPADQTAEAPAADPAAAAAELDALGWVQFSNGVAVRRETSEKFRFSTGMVCRFTAMGRAGCFRRAGTTRSRTKFGSANTPSWVSPL